MWSLQDVLNWLDENKLGSLVPTFRIHKIDGKELDRIREKNDSKVSLLKFWIKIILKIKLILINSDLETNRGSKRTARPVTNSVTKSRIYLLVSAIAEISMLSTFLPSREKLNFQPIASFISDSPTPLPKISLGIPYFEGFYLFFNKICNVCGASFLPHTVLLHNVIHIRINVNM